MRSKSHYFIETVLSCFGLVYRVYIYCCQNIHTFYIWYSCNKLHLRQSTNKQNHFIPLSQTLPLFDKKYHLPTIYKHNQFFRNKIRTCSCKKVQFGSNV